MSDDGRRCLGDIGQQDTKLSFKICPLPLGGLGHGGHHRTSSDTCRRPPPHHRQSSHHLRTGTPGFDLELSWWLNKLSAVPAAGAAEPRFHGVYGCRAAAVCPTNSVLNTVREIGNVLYRISSCPDMCQVSPPGLFDHRNIIVNV